MDAVENINSAILGEVVISGANEEQDDALRCRYFNSFEKESFGGTVKLRLLDSDNNIPSSELLELVQTQVDPVQNSGEGLGVAPIGHSVIVEAANKVQIKRMISWFELVK